MRYCGLTRRELLVDDIRECGLPDELEKNGSLFVLLRGTKGRKDGCFGAVFMYIHIHRAGIRLGEGNIC